MSIAEIIAMVRDIAFLSILMLSGILALVLFLRVSAILKSGKRIAKTTGNMLSALSQSTGAESGFASNVEKTASLLLWPARSWRTLGLIALVGVSVLAWVKNWFGIRTRKRAEDSSDREGEKERASDGDNGEA